MTDWKISFPPNQGELDTKNLETEQTAAKSTCGLEMIVWRDKRAENLGKGNTGGGK